MYVHNFINEIYEIDMYDMVDNDLDIKLFLRQV